MINIEILTVLELSVTFEDLLVITETVGWQIFIEKKVTYIAHHYQHDIGLVMVAFVMEVVLVWFGLGDR